MPSVAEMRERDDAVDVAYAIAFDGIEYIWVTGHADEGLLGSGSGSWIGDYEDAIGDTYRRTVLAGLKMPTTLRLEELDEKRGTLEQQTQTIQLVDFDDVVAAMFGRDGKDFDLLAEVIQPGTSALGTSVAVQGGDTVNPRGRFVGLERIGPSGERVDFSCLPFTRIGPQHVSFYADDGPPPVRISSQPIDHNGRWFALYRLYRDPFTGEWPHLGLQYEGGGLIAVGKLLDNGTITGDRVWSLQLAMRESLLRRTLNLNSPTEWFVPSVSASLSADEARIAVETASYSDSNDTLYASLSLDGGVSFSLTLDRATALSELSTALGNVVSASGTDYGGVTGIDGFGSGDIRVTPNGIGIRTDANGDGLALRAHVIMHEKVWRLLGYDPPLQDVSPVDQEDERQISFTYYGAGSAPLSGGALVPTEGYWGAAIFTVALGRGTDPNYDDNGGSYRYYRPIYTGDIQLFYRNAQQQFSISYDRPFLEGSPPVPRTSAEIDGSSVDVARYFAFSGKRAKAAVYTDGVVLDEDGQQIEASDVEGVDTIIPARVSWVETSYGQPIDVDGSTTLYLEVWDDPSKFGFASPKLDGEWVGLSEPGGGDEESFQIKCLPLACYGYHDPDTPQGYDVPGTDVDLAYDALCQLLLSTGTSTTWSGAIGTGATFTRGSNGTAGGSWWSHDVQTYDLGLAIPYQLVADVDDIADAFGSGKLNHTRYSYLGPFESTRMIESILLPRGLAMSLRGGRFGVVRLAIPDPDDVDFEIGEDDLDDPYGDKASQVLRAVGQVDETKLSYPWDAVNSTHNEEHSVRARDGNSRDRFGDLNLQLKDDGAVRLSLGEWRQLWSHEMPEFFSSRHFKVTGIRVKRSPGQDIHVGSSIRLTQPWLYNGSTYGIAGMLGIVTSVAMESGSHVYVIDVLIFAGQSGARLWAPIGLVTDLDGSIITVDGTSPLASAPQFGRPAWASGSEATVQLVSWDGRQWAAVEVGEVVSAAGSEVEVTGTVDNLGLRDRDVYLAFAPYESQSASDSWVLSYLSVNVLATHRFGASDTKGWPLL